MAALDANIAQGEAKCFNNIKAACMLSALFHVKHKQDKVLTILKNFHPDINIFAGSLYSLNGGSLSDTHKL